jgi:hypothetical protein
MVRTRGEKNGWFVTVMAGVLFTVSGCMALNNLWFIRSAVKTNGVVVSNRKENIASKGGEYFVYIPTVEFFDLQGAAHRLEPSTGTLEPTPVGTTLPILYPPGDPASARVGSSFLWDRPIGLALFAMFVLMFGCLVIVTSRWLVKRGVPMRT